MEKRALIAVAISIFILVFYQEVVLRRFYPQVTTGEPVERATATAPTPALEASASAPQTATFQPAPPAPRPRPEGRRISVDTDLFLATFNSAGARLESFQLKKYRTTVDPTSPPQEMIVPGHNGELPFGVELGGAQPASDANLIYGIDSGDLQLTGNQEGTLDFTAEENGVVLHKRFAFRGDRYDFSAVVQVQVPQPPGDLAISWVKGQNPTPPPGSEVLYDHVVYLEGRKFNEEPLEKLTGSKNITGEIRWAGYAGRHFLAAMVPVEAENERLGLSVRDGTVDQKLIFPATAEDLQQRLTVFIGPKDFDVLEHAGFSLSRAVNLGWFGFIAVPLLHELKLSHTVTGNYGVDIILLTIIIKILFIPLTQRSFKSMQAMQKLQPQMAKIRERFKDTPEQMNKEIMELYRRHKVNPLGGCLPMVLQIPVFIGLYQALLNTVELRHAAFFLWINDLSAPDRLGAIQLPFVQHPGVPVLTLLMGVSMFVQQWMTPSAADPAQQRVMMIMPLMFTFMFVNFPSGLALYWLVNNLLTIAQQFYMNRTVT